MSNEEITKITFKIPKALSKQIAIYGINNDISAQQIFNDALQEWVEKHIPKPAAKFRLLSEENFRRWLSS